jgi:crotonobetainyl-CoA:carnitine CoA-transferase CaiB-like acyl-CoA transferase
VLDLTSTLSGPYGTLLLADLGGDVVKIEPPSGDPIRDIGPRSNPDMGAIFMNANRGKRSAVLDLSSEDAWRVLKGLCDSADVVIHNMRPDTAIRRRVDADSLREGHPELIHCAIRGFGAGPYGDEPAYDDIIQAASGMAAMQEWLIGKPSYVGSSVVDKSAGMAAAMVICAALYRRSITGVGCAIEVPMFEVATALAMVEHLYGRTFEPPKGEAKYPRQATPARRPVRTADGWIAVMVYTNEQWARFLSLIGRPELVDDPRFRTLGSRTDNIDEVLGLVESVLAQYTTEHWLEQMAMAKIAAHRYVLVDDLFDDPHLRATGFFRRHQHPTEGQLVQIPTPLQVDGRSPGVGPPVRRLGADTTDVFGPSPWRPRPGERDAD